jgi:hypothetical protein
MAIFSSDHSYFESYGANKAASTYRTYFYRGSLEVSSNTSSFSLFSDIYCYKLLGLQCGRDEGQIFLNPLLFLPRIYRHLAYIMLMRDTHTQRITTPRLKCILSSMHALSLLKIGQPIMWENTVVRFLFQNHLYYALLVFFITYYVQKLYAHIFLQSRESFRLFRKKMWKRNQNMKTEIKFHKTEMETETP